MPPDPPNLLRRVNRESRRLRRGWTRDRLGEVGITLAWTIPLTLLLWVWAQDQQIEEQTLPGVRLSLEHEDPGVVVRRVDPVTGRPSDRAGADAVAVTLRGTRAGLAEAVRPLREQAEPLRVGVGVEPTERVRLDLRAALGAAAQFADAGVSVVGVSPASMEVRVERLAEARARVVPGGTLPADELAEPPIFEPAQITIRGPEAVVSRLNELAGEDGPVAAAQLSADPADPRSAAAALAAPDGAAVEEQVPVALPIDLAGRLRVAVGSAEAGRLTFEPPRVLARFARRPRAYGEVTLATVLIWIEQPAAFEEVARVTFPDLPEPRVTDVRLRGPAAVVDRIRAGGEDAPPVVAKLRLDPADRTRMGRPIDRRLELVLPPGVEALDPPPVVTFVLQPASAD